MPVDQEAGYQRLTHGDGPRKRPQWRRVALVIVLACASLVLARALVSRQHVHTLHSSPIMVHPAPAPCVPLPPAPVTTAHTALHTFLATTNLTLPQLHRSRDHSGNTYRLREVARKLLAGESVQILVLGGSVSAMRGAKKPRAAWMGGGRCQTRCGYSHMLQDLLTEHFPPSRGQHRVHNLSVRGTSHTYANSVLLKLLDEGVRKHGGYDLVILEYALNDMGHMEKLHDMERVIRKLLLWEGGQPAFMYLCLMLQWDTTRSDMIMSHAHLIRHYDVPQVSPWPALHQELFYLGTPAMSLDWDTPPRLVDLFKHKGGDTPDSYFVDGSHVSHFGHKLLADMLMWSLLQVVSDLDMLMTLHPQRDWLHGAEGVGFGVHPFYEQPPALPSEWFYEQARVNDVVLLTPPFYDAFASFEVDPGFLVTPCSDSAPLSEWEYRGSDGRYGWMAFDSESPSTGPVCFTVPCPSANFTLQIGYLVSYRQVAPFQLTVWHDTGTLLDVLVDPMREEHYSVIQLDYIPISARVSDARQPIDVTVRLARQPQSDRYPNRVRMVSLGTFQGEMK